MLRFFMTADGVMSPAKIGNVKGHSIKGICPPVENRCVITSYIRTANIALWPFLSELSLRFFVVVVTVVTPVVRYHVVELPMT